MAKSFGCRPRSTVSSRIASAMTKWVTSSDCSANSTAVRSKNRATESRASSAAWRSSVKEPASFWDAGIRPKTTLASETVGRTPPRP